MKFKKLWLYILTPLLVLLGSAALTNTVQAKELQNVITDVGIWDVDNGKLMTPDANGVYNLTTEHHGYYNYKYSVNFDLSKYNGDLNDGDTFTFTIPAPLSVKAETFDITDKETGVAVASANVVSSGDNKGGKVTVTLKQLKEYLAKKGGTQIENVKGNFFTSFSIKEEKEKTTITYPSQETKDNVTHVIKVSKPIKYDYTGELGRRIFLR